MQIEQMAPSLKALDVLVRPVIEWNDAVRLTGSAARLPQEDDEKRNELRKLTSAAYHIVKGRSVSRTDQ